MTATTAPIDTAANARHTLTAGTVVLTVRPSESFVTAMALCGTEFHDEYVYRLETVPNKGARGSMTFLHTLTARPKAGPTWVYTGVVDPRAGTLRLTGKSAFPEHATRVRIARRVLAALCSGRAADVAAAGWDVTAEITNELPDRF